MEQSNVEVTNYSGVRLYRYNKVIYYGIGDECRYDRFIPYVVRKGLSMVTPDRYNREASQQQPRVVRHYVFFARS